MSVLAHNRQMLLHNIHENAIKNAQNPDHIRLIAVSKTFPASDIRTLYECGQRDFGENYIQEFQEKVHLLENLTEIQWHIIGHIQSNKSKIVAEHAHWVHTLDRVKLAQRLHQQRPKHLPPLNVLIEINISQDPNKHGIAPNLAEMLALAKEILNLPNLCLRGLMCVASADVPPEKLKPEFNQMNDLLKELRSIAPQADILSMGMSGDWQIALACGANMLRVGSAIFGKRDYSH